MRVDVDVVQCYVQCCVQCTVVYGNGLKPFKAQVLSVFSLKSLVVLFFATPRSEIIDFEPCTLHDSYD